MLPNSYAGEITLAARTPRPVKVTSYSWTTRIFLYLCFFTVVALTLSFELLFVGRDRALLDHGKIIYAKVIGKNVHASQHTTYWYLNYKYEVNTKFYTGNVAVEQREYDATRIGGRILITYLLDEPGTNEAGIVTQKTVQKSIKGAMFIPGLFTCIFALIATMKETVVRNHVHLLRDGIEAQAIVTSKRSAGGWSWRSPIRYWITCSYYNGQKATINEYLAPFALYNAADIGSSLSVLYLPKSPQINALYRTISDVTIRS